MAAERSEKSPFESKYGGGWVTAAQYLAEGMVARQARTKGADVPHRFWNKPQWKRDFLVQLRHAASLLMLYDAEAIIRVLRAGGKKAFTLSAPWLDPLFQVEHDRLLKERERRQSETVEQAPQTLPTKSEPPREAFTKQTSPLDKLRKLD